MILLSKPLNITILKYTTLLVLVTMPCSKSEIFKYSDLFVILITTELENVQLILLTITSV